MKYIYIERMRRMNLHGMAQSLRLLIVWRANPFYIESILQSLMISCISQYNGVGDSFHLKNIISLEFLVLRLKKNLSCSGDLLFLSIRSPFLNALRNGEEGQIMSPYSLRTFLAFLLILSIFFSHFLIMVLSWACASQAWQIFS